MPILRTPLQRALATLSGEMALDKSEKRLLAGAFLAAAGLVFLGRRRGSGACKTVPLTYVERYTGGAKPGDDVPVVVFFHSRGARPEGFTSFANRIKQPARVLFPGGPYTKGDRHSWMQVGSIGDQEKFAAQLQSSGELAAEFIRCMAQGAPVVVTGTSQGGHMAYYLTSRYPGLVRGGVAVAGYLPEQFWNSGMAATYAAHGTQDTTVPFARTKEFWDTMQDQGANLGTKTFNVGHTTSGMGSWWGARVNELLP